MSLLYRHPRIHTGVIGAAPVTGVLTDGELITAVGDAPELAAAAPAGTAVVDLPGAAVLPGLCDAHVHTLSLARALGTVDVRTAVSLDEAIALLAGRAARLPPGAWLVGTGWDGDRWRPRVRADRTSLDRICPDRPVLVSSLDAHSAWVNSAALRRGGIDDQTPDPQGGRYERDADGRLTGILRETATVAVQQALARDVPDDPAALLARAQQHLLAVGVTSIHDIDGEDALSGFRALHRAGELGVRVHKAVRAEHLDTALAEGRSTGDGDAWLSTGPLKIFADGALGSHTCHMSRPFAGDGDNTGIAVTDDADIDDLAGRAVAAGLAVATHAIGDRANQRVLDAYQRLTDRVAAPLPPLRIEHAQFLRPVDLPRMARLGVIASMQPTHCTTDLDLVDELLAGHDVLSYAWRSVLDAGAVLAFGSDAPVEPPNPFHGLQAAVTRARADGSPAGGWQPEERVTVAQALSAYTRGGAEAAGVADRGVLGPGMLADMVAVDTDPLSCPPDRIGVTKVLATVVGGAIR